MIPFSKYQGAGNDFILIDDRALFFPTANPPLIQKLCDRKFGIGADGVILLQRGKDFRMRIFNRDGSEAESCGNGLRCLLRFAEHLGYPRQSYAIETMDRVVQAHFVEDQIGIEMGVPRDLRLHWEIEGESLHFVDTGVPHAVVLVEDFQTFSFQNRGAYLRHHPQFGPRGANVNFVKQLDSGALQVRTFERGVEGETLSCGTGATAVAAVAAQLFQLPSPIITHFPGGVLAIYIHANGVYEMVGPAEKVFEGTFSL